jgi:glutathione S-transferase
MMYKVYGRPGSGSVVVEALLEEIGAKYETELVDRNAVPDNYFKISPLGQVPALILPDGRVMTESAAITIHLADTHPAAKLAPKPDAPDRCDFLRWIVYLSANIYMTDLIIYYPDRYTADQNGGKCVKTAALARMAMEWDIYAAALGDKPYILGDKMCAADIYASMLATWNLDVPAFFRKHPNVHAMYERVTSRPAVAKVWARGEMEEWKI